LLKWPRVGNSKHYQTSGPFSGLWVRTAGALRKAGYKSRRKVRDDIEGWCVASLHFDPRLRLICRQKGAKMAWPEKLTV
jgi:hypothetical protein